MRRGDQPEFALGSRAAGYRSLVFAAVMVMGLVVGGGGCLSSPGQKRTEPDTARLEARSVERLAREITVRVRNTNCEGISLGSGISLGGGKVLTAHHVVAGAEQLELSGWDGNDIEVGTISATALNDIAFLRTGALSLPVAEERRVPLPVGTDIQAVGYPQGGALRIDHGRVVGTVSGVPYGQQGDLVRAELRVEAGNSGGPALDRSGRLVGVVFAKEGADHALIIPIASVNALPESSFQAVAGLCVP